MRENLGKSFSKLIASSFANISGVSVQKKGSGYIFRGIYYESKEGVEAKIKEMAEALKKSIK